MDIRNLEIRRWTIGKMQNPVRGFLHGGAAVAAATVTIFFVVSPLSAIQVGAVIFGLSLVGLFTTSSLYHAIPWRQAWKKRMQRIDHSMILVVIAATYTPLAIASFGGSMRWVALAVAWGVVAVGVGQHVLFPREQQNFSMILAISMGWLGGISAWRFISVVGWQGVALAATGGVIYSVGMLLLVTNRPRLWPRVFSYHEVFHVMVVTASAIHVVMIWRYVLPLAEQGI